MKLRHGGWRDERRIEYKMADTTTANIKEPFDIETEKLFCARCGRQCEPLGHMMGMFLLCPVHGEFTMAPTVMKDDYGKWNIHYRDEHDMWKQMWDSCKAIDEMQDART